ncbi:MAG: acetyl/propionyl-CoA carboxylase subunit alpha [Rhodobacteraceae bacterium]|nr:acetyl/propionyl-CoA carboxylase subunit alpha [Paracoccaceae bacterium]
MSFSSVLIANRGEIACRLIGACQGLGLRTVAVYSDADRDAPHVALADAAVHIGPSEAALSYLDGDKIIAAAAQAGAGAIHPGYGFLAENADFAQACADAGLEFVGPSPENIRLMGSKIAAKAAAVAANVPVVPGYYGTDQSDDLLLAEALKIGAPLLIKASAGGGGRGMRQVHDLDFFAEELALARAEAVAAFGDGQVLLERYVGTARHIEVQILGDRHGNVRHLFERDCSLQRNHQKVIEEAPAPNLAPDIRAHLLESAVRLTEGIGYDSAGTIEYLFDATTGEYYFLEMNTRLQVEHPVTEAVTGIDIAQWQMRVAQGEPLPFAQDDIHCNGCSIEARIAAEDPANGYLPETGLITAYSEPDRPDLRIDSGVRAGSVVSHYYDSMLAKLIAQGPDRASVIRLLDRGLEGFHINGPGNNIAFLRDLLAMPDFVDGTHSTASLHTTYPDGWAAPIATALQQAQAVMVRFLAQADTSGSNPWTTLGAWRITEPSGRQGAALYQIEGEAARIVGRNRDYTIHLADKDAITVTNATLTGDTLCFEIEGLRHAVTVHISDSTVTLHGPDGRVSLEVLASDGILQTGSDADVGSGNQVLSPMPGLVTEIMTQVGQQVSVGQPVLVIEAMKLLQTLTAPCDGEISEIRCAPGNNVEKGAVLAILTPKEDS